MLVQIYQTAWMPRLLFAALLCFGSEIILWTDIGSRSLPEWLILIPAYLALAALILELAALYRARSVFEAMTLMGIYGIANGLLINPATALVEVPRTLVTRAMGGHALVGLAMFALFMYLWRGVAQRGRRPLIVLALCLASAVVGALWGAWARWSPVDLFGRAETPLTTILAVAGAAIAVITILLLVARGRPATPSPPDESPLSEMAAAFRKSAVVIPFDHTIFPRLTRREWAICLIVLAALAIVRFGQGVVDGFSAIAMPLLILYCLGVLYFRQRKKGGSFLDGGDLHDRYRWRGFPIMGAVLLMMGAVSYLLPRTPEMIGTEADPVTILAVIFTAYGLVWLPCVSLVLGAQAFARQARAFRL